MCYSDKEGDNSNNVHQLELRRHICHIDSVLPFSAFPFSLLALPFPQFTCSAFHFLHFFCICHLMFHTIEFHQLSQFSAFPSCLIYKYLQSHLIHQLLRNCQDEKHPYQKRSFLQNAKYKSLACKNCPAEW
uniref:Uncharacterized protein n=1 Tax=Micrurus spixii TaxID=129469 RepID=A0A2D4LKR7_9SAUR